jgi:hypothetical protein
MKPWENEPDDLEWVDEATGYTCAVIRMTRGGHLNGYVRLPEGHPLHGIEYDADLPPALKPIGDVEMEAPIGKRGAIDALLIAWRGEMHAGDLFNVHGSVTYSGELRSREGFWYGFDCAHAGDLCPIYAQRYSELDGGTYRDLAYVQQECRSLALQLFRLAG